MQMLTALIAQRADPHIAGHTGGYDDVSASVPEYKRIALRRARTIAELASAKVVDVWHKPESGPYSELLWAPELRTYTEIIGDPLWNPDRHTYVKPLRRDEQGTPLFGKPSLAWHHINED